MTRIKRFAVPPLAAGMIAAGLFAAAPAQAAPAASSAPAETQMFCPFEGVQRQPDGSEAFSVEANGAGCVVVEGVDGGSRVALVQLIVAPGWTAEVKDGDRSTDDRVDVRFTQTATRDRVEVRVEPGKTEVK